MKPIWICSLLAALLCTASARAADGAIDFRGAVLTPTCRYVGTGGNSQDVALPAVPVADLKTVGATAGDTPFDIVLNGCSALNDRVAIQFSGANYNGQSGRFANTAGADAATNVSLQVLNGSGTPVKPWQSTELAPIGPGGDATVPLRVRYFAEGKVTPGKVTGAINIWIFYQ